MDLGEDTSSESAASSLSHHSSMPDLVDDVDSEEAPEPVQQCTVCFKLQAVIADSAQSIECRRQAAKELQEHHQELQEHHRSQYQGDVSRLASSRLHIHGMPLGISESLLEVLGASGRLLSTADIESQHRGHREPAPAPTAEVPRNRFRVPPKAPPPEYAAWLAMQTSDLLDEKDEFAEKEQIAEKLRALQPAAEKEQIAEKLQALQPATEKEQFAGDLQALQPATKKDQFAGELQALPPATERKQFAGELQALQPTMAVEKSTKEKTTITEQAATSANSRQASPGSSIATLTKQQIELELEALETVTAQAARDCVSFTLRAIQAKKEHMDEQILEMAMNVEVAKEKVCRISGTLVGKLCATQHVMKLQGRDAGELQALETAIEQATATVNAFMAGFED